VPGIQIYLQNPPPIQLGGHLTESQYQYTLEGTDTTQLYRLAPVLQSKIAALPDVQDVTSDLQIHDPQVSVEINRDKASALGVTADQVETALADAYGSRQVSTIYTPTNEYWVILEVLPRYQQDPGTLSNLYIQSASGQLVPLRAVATLTPGVGPLTINHQGQLPAVTISFNLKPGVALGTAVNEIEGLARSALPATIIGSFQGSAQAFQSSLKDLGLLLIMAIMVIYIVLGILYESFIHPLTILSGLPAAGVGALATLLLFHVDLNIYSFIGVIMLVGLVKKNAIMMVDFALDAQRQGKSARDAIYEGCLLRFRPIMMTTTAALMATLPIAFGTGQGAESRRPLGLAVVGGLLVSQLLTLYITPVIFTYLEAFRERLGRRLSAGPASAGAPVPRLDSPEGQ
jgi:HAE1 family hydrophobic/amphiphilic exporter-1